MKPLIKKTLPILLTLALTGGCCTGNYCYTSKISNLKTKILGTKYTSLTYDGMFSVKGPSSKSDNGLEVFVAKYKDKNRYEKGSILKAPINELTYGWEIILTDINKIPHRLTNNSLQEYHPKISPDGNYVIFERWDDKNKKSDIYKMDLAISYVTGKIYPEISFTETKLTDKGSCERPAISPDGKTIAFNYQGNIWTMDSDGKNQKELLNLNVDIRISEWNKQGLVFSYGDSMHPNAIIDFEKNEVKDYSLGNE